MAEVARTNSRVLTAETLADLQALGSNDGIESNMVAYATNQNAWLRPTVINPTTSTWTTISGGASNLDAVLTVGNDSGGNNIQMSGGGIITASGQDLTLSASTGLVTTPGDMNVDGKLTVDGLIDPTGLLLNSQGTAPATPAGNDGLIWVNASGELMFDDATTSVNITQSLLGQGSFLDAFSRAQYGHLGPSSDNGATSTAAISSSGFLGDSEAVVSGASTVSVGQDTGEGYYLELTTGGVAGNYAAVQTPTVGVARRENSPLFVFSIRQNTFPTDRRIFIGLTDQLAATHATDADPVAGSPNYIGVIYDASGSFLSFSSRNSASGSTVASTVSHATTALLYVVIDMSAGSGGDAIVQILDEDYNILDSSTFLAAAPGNTSNLRALALISRGASGAPVLNLYHGFGINEADKIATITGGGGGGGSQSLAQVLTVGATTGGTDITFTDGDQIVGESVAAPSPLIFQAGDSSSGNGDGGDIGFLAGDGNGTGAGGSVVLIAGAPQVAQNGDGGDITLTATDGASSASSAGGVGGGIIVTFGDGGNATAGSGNGGAAQDLDMSLGSGGSSVGGAGGAGAGFSLLSGAGGAVSGGTGNGGASGAFLYVGSNGGNSVGGAGGDAGDITFTGGAGGNATGGTGDGGDGTSIILAAGNGGTTVGGTAGVGGNIELTVGSGSTNGQILIDTAATSPATVTMKVADVGTGNANNLLLRGSTSPDADGGNLTLTAGDSSAGGVGGDVNLNGGGGPDGGSINLTSGAGTTTGGDIILTTGTNSGSGGAASITLTGAGTSDAAGDIVLAGGNQVGTPSGSASGGNVQVQSGSGATNASGDGNSSGDVVVQTPGGVSPTVGDGGETGSLSLVTGAAGDGGTADGSTGGAAGPIVVLTGDGGDGGPTNGNGGDAGSLSITAGAGGNATGTGTQGDGGNIIITAGASGTGGAGGGTGGSITLVPGAGTLAAGTISWGGLIDRDATGYKHGTVAAGAAVTTNPITFATAFPSGPPLTINVTIEGPVAGPPPIHWINTISGTGFTVEFAAAPGAGYVIHWSARQ